MPISPRVRARASLGVVAVAATALTVATPALAVESASPTSSAAHRAGIVASDAERAYIVRFKDPAKGGVLGSLPLGQLVDQVLGLVGQKPDRLYRSVFRGAAVTMTPAQAKRLRDHRAVASVSIDRPVTAFDTQPNATWGLDRVDQRSLPLNGNYVYPGQAGAGTHVYVVDTGINGNHAEFAGRMGTGRNFISAGLFGGVDPQAWSDCNGHGTHVASSAAGTTWGVAKRATVHAVRVLGCNGSGSSSAILGGLDWIAANAQRPAVVNMSLGTSGGRSPEMEAAVRRLHAAGISVVVAAGNDNANACTTSPAAEPVALTVGATANNDARSSFSNFGTCVDIFAPGSNITAAAYNSNSGATMLSGTSMAAPHVAGAAALVAGQGITAPQDITTRVLGESTPNVVVNAGVGSPNRLLFVSNAGSPTVDAAPSAVIGVNCTALTCQFNGSGSTDDRGISAYAWTFGDQTTSTVANPSKTYAAGGSYTVTLRVTDTAGQSSSATRVVTVTASSAPCSSCTAYQGSLTAGAQALHPSSGFSYSGGTLRGYLRGPNGADFDLYLQRQQCGLLGCSWRDVASAVTSSSTENLAYSASSGTYRWRVLSYAGSGSYTLYGEPR